MGVVTVLEKGAEYDLVMGYPVLDTTIFYLIKFDMDVCLVKRGRIVYDDFVLSFCTQPEDRTIRDRKWG